MFDHWFILFSLVFARVGGLTMTAPIYGTRAVPLQARVLLAGALALVVAPLQCTSPPYVCRPTGLSGALGL